VFDTEVDVVDEGIVPNLGSLAFDNSPISVLEKFWLEDDVVVGIICVKSTGFVGANAGVPLSTLRSVVDVIVLNCLEEDVVGVAGVVAAFDAGAAVGVLTVVGVNVAAFSLGENEGAAVVEGVGCDLAGAPDIPGVYKEADTLLGEGDASGANEPAEVLGSREVPIKPDDSVLAGEVSLTGVLISEKSIVGSFVGGVNSAVSGPSGLNDLAVSVRSTALSNTAAGENCCEYERLEGAPVFLGDI
jgi:hypothetical protein